MIKELSIFEFDEFAKKHPLRSYHQTSSYAILMSKHGYNYNLIGYIDEYNNLVAASVILLKKIKNHYLYGYAPKGFLLDFYNPDLLKKFTKAIAEYYYKKKVVFIKINPEIAIGEAIKDNNYKVLYNQNVKIVDSLTTYGYKQLKPNYAFETLIPRFNAIVNLSELNINSVSKTTRGKIKKSERQGLYLEKANIDKMDIFYKFIKNKKDRKINYYKDYYNAFDKFSEAELLLLKVNYKNFLVSTQEKYEEELEINNFCNQTLQSSKKKSVLNSKMESDKKLHSLKEDILLATNKIKSTQEEYLGGALIIKHDNRIYFVRTGFNDKYTNINSNHFMYYKIMELYKNEYKFADLNGVTGLFNDKNDKYYGLNQFKLSFNPKIFEFIGEFDLIIDSRSYSRLEKRNLLSKEFTKQ
ncbi:MAG TPA: peptidoglycan bridge formation glycyltransferase FemA/FemB family protein [Bacilli bacterium]|nr:peptidoglycan bridge formation glycyltransferase FemA/FemB family protein [Bacilli bacterium]